MKDLTKGVLAVILALALWDGIKYIWNLLV
jgi:hypothetical protein